MRSVSTSNWAPHGWRPTGAGAELPLSDADTLLQEELPAYNEQLSDDILSIYHSTDVGRSDGGRSAHKALRAYFESLSNPNAEARAMSLDRIAVLYARAGLDLSAHFDVSARLFALLAERATFRWRTDPMRLSGALVEIQRRLWEDARRVTDAFVQARERHLGQLVKHLSLARTEFAKLAHDDPLTGVRNRAYLVETLILEIERAQRYGEPFSLLFADLDHFKSINDAHGHQTGDKVLQQVASLIKRELRPQDVVGRYGGDEFVIGLVRTNEPTAHQVAERLRSAVEATHLQAEPGSPLITLSLGIMTIHGGTERVVELIRRADEAMYCAKAAGRNQVRLAFPR